MLTPKDKAVAFRNLARAYNKRDALACAAVFAEKGIITLWDGTKIEGREQIEGYYRRVFTATPDAHTEILRVLTPAAETAIVEHTLEGTSLGPFTLGTRQMAPTGRAFRTTMLGTYTFSPDGKVSAAKFAYDPFDLYRQMGALKAPFVNEEMAIAQVRTFLEAYGKHDIEAAAACLTEFVRIGANPTTQVRGRAFFKADLQNLLTAVPDLKLTINHIVADDNVVVATYQLKGTHTASISGIKSTGKTFEGEEQAVFEVGPAGIFAFRQYSDNLQTWTQLGVVKL